MYPTTQHYNKQLKPDDIIQHQTPAQESLERNEMNQSTGQDMG